MRTASLLSVALLLGAGAADAERHAVLRRCPVDAVVAGTVCMDAYEASVWRVPNAQSVNLKLVKQIQQGSVTEAALLAAGATHQGISDDNYGPCLDSGQNCAGDLFAVSLPGVLPSIRATWFQAQAACLNSRKRLPSNAEWQAAVAGTPDPGPDNGATDCRTTGSTAVATGSRTACVSSVGAYDMVGNLYEWVADWSPRATACGTWPASVSPAPSDQQCLAGAATTGEPAALVRGGNFASGTASGPLAVAAVFGPSASNTGVGFRCAR
jgi:formylglycine-generating enzyme required for sulfatase activity